MAKVIDKATAFKNEISGSTTNKIVCKAASHEVAGPKKKHVDYLLQLTSSPHCQIPVLVDLVGDRLRNTNWVVVFKGLIVSHNLMSLGNEKYIQCVATKQHMFNLDTFNDKSDFLATDMSVHVRKYARYMSSYAAGYKIMALDVCRVPKGEESPFRTMETTKVLKAAAAIQRQLDCLLEIEVSSSDLTNGVINTAFLMLYKDLIKLYTAYNDILINLLDKFFESKKSQCKETIEAYRKFLTRQEGVQKFLSLAEEVGVDKSTHKDLRKVPDDLLPALEEHLSEMDSLRKANASQPSPVIKAASEKLSALSSVAPKKPPLSKKQSSGSGIASGLPSASEEILEAQKKRFEELKRQATLKGSPDKVSVSSQEAEPPKKSSSNDLLGLDSAFGGQQPAVAASAAATQQPTSSFNPWATATTTTASATSNGGIPQTQPVSTATSNNPFQPQAAATATVPTTSGASSDPWGVQGQTTGYQEVDLFSEIRGVNFDNVFGSSEPQQQRQQAPAFGGNPVPQQSASVHPSLMGGDILMPQAVGPLASQSMMQPQPQRLTKDVDSSLARAAENLSIEMSGSRGGIAKKAEHQWGPTKESVKTGGANYIKQQLQPRSLPPGAGGGAPVDWSKGSYAGYFPNQPPMQQQPVMMQPGMMQPGMMQPGMGMGMMQPGMGMMPQQQFTQQPQGGMWSQQPVRQQPADPFGSLGQHASLF